MKALNFNKYLCTLGVLLLIGSAAHADDGFLASQVSLNYSHVNGSNGNVNVFVPTGSESGVCLVTPNDSNGYGAGPSPAICVPRVYQGQKGVVILMIPYFAPFPTNLSLLVTVYQHGAKFYGQPVFYPNL